MAPLLARFSEVALTVGGWSRRAQDADESSFERTAAPWP
jgi:hypothetical protein